MTTFYALVQNPNAVPQIYTPPHARVNPASVIRVKRLTQSGTSCVTGMLCDRFQGSLLGADVHGFEKSIESVLT